MIDPSGSAKVWLKHGPHVRTAQAACKDAICKSSLIKSMVSKLVEIADDAQCSAQLQNRVNKFWRNSRFNSVRYVSTKKKKKNYL